MAVSVAIAVGIIICASWTATAINTTDSLQRDAHILLSFMQDLSKSDGAELHGWDAASAGNVCNWTGILCDKRNLSVIGLDLSQKRLMGSISPTLGQLSHLELLNLSSNQLIGSIPRTLLTNCLQLANFSLSTNSLSGTIPAEISNCSALTNLDLSNNGFYGTLPSDIGKLYQLQNIILANNLLTGPIPVTLSNCSQLRLLNIENNSIWGGIPVEFSVLLRLEILMLGVNKLSGEIPVPLLVNCTRILHFGVEFNGLSGPIPPDFSRMARLQQLWVMYNKFSGSIPEIFGNLSQLQLLVVIGNKLTGQIPKSLGYSMNMVGLGIARNALTGEIPVELSNMTRLEILRAGSNKFTGVIPQEVGRMRSLSDMEFYENFLSGQIPFELGNCSSLVILNLYGNLYISGRIPEEIGRLRHLTYLDLGRNQITAGIPDSLSNCTMLQNLSLGYNQLTGNIPAGVAGISSLIVFSVPHNLLTGAIPVEFGGMIVVTKIDLSENKLGGSIPDALAGCVELVKLNLSHNSLVGEIPSQLADLQSLEDLDISFNALSGRFPQFLSQMKALTYLNVSYNHFEGPLPESGVFGNVNASSFLGNNGLCGPIVDAVCPTNGTSKHGLSKPVIWIVAATGILAAGSIGLYFCIWLRRGDNGHGSNRYDMLPQTVLRRYTAKDVLEMTAGFSEDNVVGEGALAKVYKGTFVDGSAVAVKRLKVLQDDNEESKRSFISELQSLGMVRHRNLVRILGFCAEMEAKAVILELMPNGSLEKQLHEIQRMLSWKQKKIIAIGVAEGLMYLHHEGVEPIVHCDIKPSNILLDAELTPHLADFGVARILRSREMMRSGDGGISTSNIRGTIGYMAPEYGYSGRVTTKGDVYSFGVVLLEMVTGTRPVSDIFGPDGTRTSLVQWVEAALHKSNDRREGAVQATQQLQMQWAASEHEEDVGEIRGVLEIALRCCEENPSNRPTMRQVVRMLSNNAVYPNVKALAQSPTSSFNKVDDSTSSNTF